MAITPNEISKAIASILARHGQFDSVFTKFEPLPWETVAAGLIKRVPNGGSMLATRNQQGKIVISFSVGLTAEDM